MGETKKHKGLIGMMEEWLAEKTKHQMQIYELEEKVNNVNDIIKRNTDVLQEMFSYVKTYHTNNRSVCINHACGKCKLEFKWNIETKQCKIPVTRYFGLGNVLDVVMKRIDEYYFGEDATMIIAETTDSEWYMFPYRRYELTLAIEIPTTVPFACSCDLGFIKYEIGGHEDVFDYVIEKYIELIYQYKEASNG